MADEGTGRASSTGADIRIYAATYTRPRVKTMSTFPVILGPTAGGKSALAVELCLRLNGAGRGPAEVVTADSMQVFRGMDIGTAKPTAEERRGVVHHLIDVVEPTEPFSVDQWLKLAEAAIAEVRGRGGVPVVVGGTNLYVKALLEGLFDGPKADEALRAALSAMEPSARRAELERVDPEAAKRIHFNDSRRTVRALEVFRLTGTPISAHQSQWDGGMRPDAFVVGLEWPVEALNKRINARVKQMVSDGLVDEVRGLLEGNRLGRQAREALGYKQIAEAIEAGGSAGAIDEAVERVKIETRRFAKNQRTWLKRFRMMEGSRWFEMPGVTAADMAQHVAGSMFTNE